MASSTPILKDIAQAAGVSVMTVSNVLRPKKSGTRPLFSRETEAKVIEVARKLGYVPNRAARAMRTRQTGVVGFVAANFSRDRFTVENYGVHPFLVGLNHVLSVTGRHVALVEVDELELRDDASLPAALRERFFDALVIHYGLSPEAKKVTESLDVPVIYWDSGVFHEHNCVYRDEADVGRALTRRLISLGHKRIGFTVGRRNWQDYQKIGQTHHFSFSSRYEAYLEEMEKQGLRPLVLEGYNPEDLASQIERKKVTAVVVLSAYVPILRAAICLGRKIPEDLTILACDVETSISEHDSLGGATYNRYEAGRKVGDMVVRLLEEDSQPQPSLLLPFDVREGSTCGPHRSRRRS